MNNTLLNAACLIVGGTVGAAITYSVMKTKYERLIDERINEEVDEMRKHFENKSKKKEESESEPKVKESEEENLVKEIRKKLYSNDGEKPDFTTDKSEEIKVTKPYVIAPEETWEQDYPVICYTYFEGDRVLADEHDKIIANVDELVGEDFADHFGDYDPNVVYIQNDEMGVVYEITRDYESYENYMRN